MNATDIREIVLKMNDQDVKQKTENLETRLKNALRIKEDLEKKASTKKLTKNEANDLRKFTNEVVSCERQLSKLRSTKEQVEKVMQNLSTTGPQELRNTLAALNKEIESGKIKRGTDDWKRYQKAIRDVNTELRKVQDEQKAVEKFSFSGMLQKTANLWMAFQGAMATVTGLKSTIRDAVQAYADMEEAMADVRKYTGMSTEQVRDLNTELKEMDTRTAREKLNALAGDAGRLGIQGKQDILDFVSAADMINVALGEDLGEDAVKNIGKLAQLYGEDKRVGLKQAMLSTGSAINELAQNSSAAETYLLDFTARLAGVGKQANIAQADIMGYAAVLDESMLRDETASTAMQQLIVKIFQDPAKMAKAAGLEVKAFSELVRTDANAALLQFFDAMKARGGFDSLAPMFQEMHLNGQRAVGVLSAVADKTDLLRERQQLANKAYAEANSIQNEFDVKNDTVQAQLDKAKKRFHDLAVELGERLYPIMTSGIHLTSVLMKAVTAIIDFFSQFKTTVISVTVAIAAYTVAVNASIIADKLKVLWTEKIIVGLKKLWTVLRNNPWGAAIAAITAVVSVMIDLSRRTSELSEKMKVLADIEQDAAKAVAEEKKRLEELLAVARNEKLSREEREKAIRQIKKEYPQYLSQLSLETINTNQATQAINRQIQAMLLRNKVQKGLEKIAEYDEKIGGNVDINEGQDWFTRTLNDTKLMVADAADFLNDWVVDSRFLRGISGNIWQDRYRQADHVKENWEKQRDQLKQQVEGWMRDIEKLGGEVVSPSGGIGGTGGAGGASSSDDKKHADKTEKEHRERMKALEAEAKDLERELQKKREELAQDFVQGKKDIDQYRTAVQQAEIQTAMQQRDLYDKTLDWQVEKWKERDDKVRQLQQKQLQERHDWSVEALERQQQAELNALEERHARGLVKDEAYELERNAITLKYLRRRAAYYQQWGDASQWQKAQAEVEKESHRQRIAQLEELRRKTEQFRKEFEQKTPEQQYREMLDTFKKAEAQALAEAGIDAARIAQVRGEFASMRQAAWKKYYGPGGEVQKALSERSQKQLTEAGYFDQERTRRSDTGSGSDLAGSFIGAAGAADNLARIRSQYDLLKQLRQQNLVDEQTYNEELKRLDQETAENKVAVWQAAFAYIGAIASSISQLYQAQQQAEEASVTERYDREIQKAGENSARGKKLEEQKQKELAKIKTKYNKREMVMEMAQAAASTAMAAINAYASASKISWVLGPIAASMALAAGAIQMAAIKKQHEAQQKGYYEGGFTGGRRYRREAGVVHEGEFVASHEAVGNPNLLPVLNLIDQAQRRNRVASLTAEDVARTLYPAFAAQPAAAAAAPMVQIVDSSSERTAEALEKLNSQLDQPIQTYVVLDGPEGLHHQYGRYLRMIAKK